MPFQEEAGRPMMFRALLTIGAVQLLTMLVLLARTKTLALTLGPELVGIMAVVDKWVALLAQVGCVSLPYAAVRFLPQRWAAGQAQFAELYRRMRGVLLALMVAVTAVALLVSIVHPAAWGAALVAHRDVIVAAILGIPVIGFAPFLQNAVAGRMQQNLSMAVGLVHAIVLALCVVAVVWGGLAGYYLAYAMLGTVFVAWVAHRVTHDLHRAPPDATAPRLALPSLPAEIWRFSGALMVLASLAPCAALFVHYRLLSEHGAQAAGWMQAAMGISLAVRAILGSAHSTFLTPNVNQGGSREARMQWADRYQITLCLIAILVVPPLLLFPDLAIHVLYSREFGPGAAFVLLFVLTEVVGLVSGTYQSLVVAFDRVGVHVANNLVAQLLVIVAASFWIRPYGILGAGLALLLAPVYMLVATTLFLRRSFGLRMPRAVAVRTLWLAASLLAAGSVGLRWEAFDWEAALAKAATYAVILVGAAALLTPHERAGVRQTLGRSRKVGT